MNACLSETCVVRTEIQFSRSPRIRLLLKSTMFFSEFRDDRRVRPSFSGWLLSLSLLRSVVAARHFLRFAEIASSGPPSLPLFPRFYVNSGRRFCPIPLFLPSHLFSRRRFHAHSRGKKSACSIPSPLVMTVRLKKIRSWSLRSQLLPRVPSTYTDMKFISKDGFM